MIASGDHIDVDGNVVESVNTPTATPEPDTATATLEPDTDTPTSTPTSTPGFGVIVALTALLAVCRES